MCFIFILLVFSSCVTQVDNQSDTISTIIIPRSMLQFTGIEQDEYIESFYSNYNDIYTEVKAEGEDIVVSMTEPQRQNFIKQIERIIDNSLEDYYNNNPKYKFHGSSDYKKAEFYYDEKLSFSGEGLALIGVVGEYGLMQLLTDNTGDWNVEVKVYNCHTGKLVGEGTAPHERLGWTSEDWSKSYE